jgi:hypothetical protein
MVIIKPAIIVCDLMDEGNEERIGIQIPVYGDPGRNIPERCPEITGFG